MMKKQRNVCIRMALMLAFMLSTLTMSAAGVEFLTINFGGKEVSIALADHPVITYAHNTLLVKTTTREVEIPVASITGYGFTEEPSAVRDIQRNKPSFADGHVVFTQLQPGTTVTVTAADGRQMITATVAADGTAVADLSRLPKAVYVVKAQDTSFKIINK